MSFMQGLRTYVKEPAVAAAIAAPIVGLGVNAIARRRDAARSVQERAAAYKSMLEITPRLQQHDPVLVNRVYNSMHNVNPTLARDPLVAGAWVDNVLEQRSSLGDASFGQAVLRGLEPLASMRNQLSSSLRNEGGGPAAGARASDAIRGLGEHLQKAQTNHFDFKLQEVHEAQKDLGKRREEFRGLMTQARQERKDESARAELQRRKEQLDEAERAMHAWAGALKEESAALRQKKASGVDEDTLAAFAAFGG